MLLLPHALGFKVHLSPLTRKGQPDAPPILMPCSTGITILTVFGCSFTGVKEFAQGLALYLNEEGAGNNMLIMDKHAGTSENFNDFYGIFRCLGTRKNKL